MNDQRVDHDVEAIAGLVMRIRGRNVAPGGTWDYPGIKDAVTKTLQRARDGYDDPVAVAATVALRVAANRRNRYPIVMTQPGDHWRFGDATTGSSQAPTADQACDRHPGRFAGHADCDGLAEIGDGPVDIHDLEARGLRGEALWAAERERLGLQTHTPDRQEQAS